MLWLSLVSVVAVYMAGMGWGSSVGLHAERGSRARGAWRRGCLVLTGVAASRRTLGSAFPRLTRSLTWMVDTEASLCRRGGVRLQRWGVAVSGIEGPFTGSGGLRWAGFARLMALLTRSRRRRAAGTRPRSVSHGIGWRTRPGDDAGLRQAKSPRRAGGDWFWPDRECVNEWLPASRVETVWLRGRGDAVQWDGQRWTGQRQLGGFECLAGPTSHRRTAGRNASRVFGEAQGFFGDAPPQRL